MSFNFVPDYKQFYAQLNCNIDTSIDSFLVVDTGASYSVLSPNVLVDLGLLSSDNLNGFSSFFQSMGYKGGTDLKAYPCSLSGVVISGIEVSQFFFFLPEKVTQASVLGIDFLNYCSFSHSIGADIEVDSFNYSGYKQSWLSGDIMYCLPVIPHNVKLGDLIVKTFYTYICRDASVKSALFGVDFINFCDITKDGLDIILSNFNSEDYELASKKSLASTTPVDINSIISSDGTKDLAAYFRDAFKNKNVRR